MSVLRAVGPSSRQDDLLQVPISTDFPEIRDAIRAICKGFPGKYWRDLEDSDEYAEEFVAELGKAGYLGTAQAKIAALREAGAHIAHDILSLPRCVKELLDGRSRRYA